MCFCVHVHVHLNIVFFCVHCVCVFAYANFTPSFIEETGGATMFTGMWTGYMYVHVRR